MPSLFSFSPLLSFALCFFPFFSFLEFRVRGLGFGGLQFGGLGQEPPVNAFSTSLLFLLSNLQRLLLNGRRRRCSSTLFSSFLSKRRRKNANFMNFVFSVLCPLPPVFLEFRPTDKNNSSICLKKVCSSSRNTITC